MVYEFYIIPSPGKATHDEPDAWSQESIPKWLYLACSLIDVQADPDLTTRILLDVIHGCHLTAETAKGNGESPEVREWPREYREKLITAALKLASDGRDCVPEEIAMLLNAAQRGSEPPETVEAG